VVDAPRAAVSLGAAVALSLAPALVLAPDPTGVAPLALAGVLVAAVAPLLYVAFGRADASVD